MTSSNSPFAPRLRGRGAASNPCGRFEPLRREAMADGWDLPEDQRLLRRELALEHPRQVITRNASPDISFDRSINPYRGCEHGCIYCYARPSHGFLGLSPGLDFETKLIARPGAPEQLARELARPGYRAAPIAIGTNTDAYQPIEREERVMRGILQVLAAHQHPATIATKGCLIERDLDILGPMAELRLAEVGISVTTLDRDLARKLEPRVPSPARRLAVIRALAGAGVPVRVMVSPVIPGLTDHEIEPILTAAAEAGAQAASMIYLRLPGEVADLFQEWLQQHMPARAEKILARLREAHGGQLYEAQWGHRMRGRGVHAELTAKRFDLACRRLGLAAQLPGLDSRRFRLPPRPGDQLSLF